MKGRTGRAAAVCAALGVLWWATVRLAWAGVGCEDWGCLVPAVGVVVVISLALLAGSALALERVAVRPGRRVALTAAGVLVVFRLAGESLPSWTVVPRRRGRGRGGLRGRRGAGSLRDGGRASRRRRMWTALAVAALLPVALVTALTRHGL